MGIMRSSFSFTMGTVCGVHIAQSYDVPNVKAAVATEFLVRAKLIEEKYRKPQSKLRDD